MACAISAGNFCERSYLLFRLFPLALQFRWRTHKCLFDFTRLRCTAIQEGAGCFGDLLPGWGCVIAGHARIFLMQKHCYQVKGNVLDLFLPVAVKKSRQSNIPVWMTSVLNMREQGRTEISLRMADRNLF